MADRIHITAEYVRSRIDYDPETGVFIWKARDGNKWWNSRYAGTVAGVRTTKRDAEGYIFVCIDYVKYGAHRLAWLYVHGEWPEHDVDHRDLDKSNNRLSNLRPASKQQNKWNEGVRRNNTSGFMGVYLYKPLNKWQAYITSNGKSKYLGIFDTPEAAAKARDKAALELRGDFANLNFPRGLEP